MASVDNILVNGTYTLRGGVDETSLATGNQPIFEANVAQIKAAFNYASYPERCTDNTNNSYHNFYCNFSDLNAYVNLAGDVTASDTGDTDICYSNGNGSSYCVFVGG